MLSVLPVDFEMYCFADWPLTVLFELFNLRHTFGGQIEPQGYDFICNFIKYGSKKIPLVTFPKNAYLSK